MSRRSGRPRCAVIRSEADLEQLQADGTLTVHDADALRDFGAFLRGEITGLELDRRMREAGDV